MEVVFNDWIKNLIFEISYAVNFKILSRKFRHLIFFEQLPSTAIWWTGIWNTLARKSAPWAVDRFEIPTNNSSLISVQIKLQSYSHHLRRVSLIMSHYLWIIQNNTLRYYLNLTQCKEHHHRRRLHQGHRIHSYRKVSNWFLWLLWPFQRALWNVKCGTLLLTSLATPSRSEP